MSALTAQTITNLVATAVLNKYKRPEQISIAQVVADTLREIDDDTEPQLRARLRPVHAAAGDVANQAIILTLIDRFWSNPPKLDRPLTVLNSCCFGSGDEAVLRSVEHVDDFGGVVPTLIEEGASRLDELERFCSHFVPRLRAGPIVLQVDFLAHVMGSVTRVHPFADGNGRTARLFVFYALRCWELPLFPIPKVRNDPAWKHAMNRAIQSDYGPLSEFLKQRLIGAGAVAD